MKFFSIHPTYLTFILTYCTVVSLQKIANKGFGVDLLFLLLYIIFSIFLMTKLNLIFQIIVVFFYLFFKIGLGWVKKMIIVVTLFLLAGSTVKYMPSLLNRFTELIISFDKQPKGLAFDSTNIRGAIYNCDLELVKKNYLFGVGFNNIQKSLNTCYASKYDSQFHKENNYMSHNYFFYIFISSGILGFVSLLFFFFYLLKLTLKIDKFILYVVVLNVILMCLIEDFFYRQFGLFSFLLLFFTHYKNHLYNQIENNIFGTKA